MKGWITLTRKQAAIKLRSITRATYYFQREQGVRYVQEAKSVQDVVQAFERDVRARLRIERETSRHVITLVNSPALKTGWDVEFS